MDTRKINRLKVLAENNDGYVSVEDAKAIGIAQTYLGLAVEMGEFQKVGKGLYLAKGYARDDYHLLHHRYKKAVFSFLSSAYLHGLLEEEPPLQVYLPTNYMTKGIEGASCRHYGDKEYNTGLSLIVSPRGSIVPCYDIERTLIDILRRREEMPKSRFLSIFEKAKKIGFYEEKLWKYASLFHVEEELKLLFYLF